jgi:hypothetical protein
MRTVRLCAAVVGIILLLLLSLWWILIGLVLGGIAGLVRHSPRW